jgi:hypothetical protein
MPKARLKIMGVLERMFRGELLPLDFSAYITLMHNYNSE